jgi:hypothetical protein
MSNLVMMPVFCANTSCPELLRTGKAKEIASLDANAQGADLWCGRCRTITYWRTYEQSQPLRASAVAARV